MKSNELMPGDWVYYGKMVVPILQLSINREYPSIKPIPITPEILEKNGFEKQGFPGWQIYTDKYMIIWRNDYPNVLDIRSFSSECGSFHRQHIDYVHELQHALRLCNIVKEIMV